jgi:hypothetical protein
MTALAKLRLPPNLRRAKAAASPRCLSWGKVWLDDDPLLAEVETLRCRGLLDRLLIVDSEGGGHRA